MASTCRFFDEDAVYRINKRKYVDVGLILENSEFLSSDEEESEDGHYPEWQRMKRGHVRIAWHPNGAEEVVPEKRVQLFDRSLMPGDVVRKIVKGKDTQLGYCRNTNVKAAVQVIGTKNVIIGVESKDLLPMEEFMADIAVYCNSWVGMVKIVKSELTVRCCDGSRGIISDLDALDLDDILDKRDRTSEFKKYSYYPGQQLWGPTYCFENAKWINLNKEMDELLQKTSKSIRVTVEDVRVVSIGVQWVCRAYKDEAGTVTEVEHPKYLIQGEDLKCIRMMNIYEPCTLQIGDRNYLVIEEEYSLVSLSDWRNEMASMLKTEVVMETPKHVPPPPPPEEVNVTENATGNELDDNDSDYEDLDDDNDSVYSDSASVTSHSTASSIDRCKGCRHKTKKGPSLATKMMKKKKLKRARRQIAKSIFPVIKVGEKVVTETLVTETRAQVIWQDGSVETDIPSTNLYPVHHLDGHEFFPGDFVVDGKDSRPHEYGVIKQVDHNGRTALITWMKTYQAGTDPKPEILSEQEVSVYDIKDHPDFRYRPGSCVIRVANFLGAESESTAGQVVDVHPTGHVEVAWVSGQTSLCYPQELYRVGEYDSDDLWGDDNSLCDEDSWETESEASLVGAEECDKEFENAINNSCLKSDKDEEKSVEDPNSIQEKLLANIEKLRAGMARLEEVFTQNPTLQTCNVMRRLLELYKHCKVLDQLLGTTYFHEKHLQSLVDRLRHRGRVNSIQHMADQISRLFSMSIATSEPANSSPHDPPDDLHSAFVISSEEFASEKDCDLENSTFCSITEGPIDNGETCDNNLLGPKSDCELRHSNALLSPIGMFPVLPNCNEPRNICQQLCSILKSRLLIAHEDVEKRFGMSHRDTTNALLAAETDFLLSETGATSPIELNLPVPCGGTAEEVFVPSDPTPETEEAKSFGQGEFSVCEAVPGNHKYKLSILQPSNSQPFFKTVRKEIQILRTSLPEGIIVKGFEDRIDLYSVLIKGPKRTPYEDGLFLFDFQLPADYPKVPPLCHYISYCSDRLNPNLYEGGRVCVSLLGTWGGKGTEVWSPESSNILQVIVSIQGLILVAEPYYNEAGYERQRGTQLGRENSRMYNEMVILKLVQAMTKIAINPPEIFKSEIIDHLKSQASKLIWRLEQWLSISESWNSVHPTTPTTPRILNDSELQACIDLKLEGSSDVHVPEFPLIPASKGFCLTLRKSINSFKEAMESSTTLLI